jgi:hypothetical protein
MDTRGNFSKGGKIMETGKKEIYVEPKIIATYSKEDLEETIKLHGSIGISPGDQVNNAH